MTAHEIFPGQSQIASELQFVECHLLRRREEKPRQGGRVSSFVIDSLPVCVLT